MHAVCNALSTCALVQKEPFINSRNTPTATPKIKPPAAANRRTKAVLGLLLLDGGKADVRMRASEIGIRDPAPVPENQRPLRWSLA